MDDKNQALSGSQTDSSQVIQDDISQIMPVSPPQKEHESVFASEPETKLHAEVIEAGVEKVSEMPINSDHEKAGIKLAKESVPVKTSPSGIVRLPLTTKQAKSILKAHKKVTDSILWFAILVLRQIKKMRVN